MYLHNTKKTSSILSFLLTNLIRNTFAKIGPTCKGKWLIHGPKHGKDNSQNPEKINLPVEYHSLECKHDAREFYSNEFD